MNIIIKSFKQVFYTNYSPCFNFQVDKESLSDDDVSAIKTIRKKIVDDIRILTDLCSDIISFIYSGALI